MLQYLSQKSPLQNQNSANVSKGAGASLELSGGLPKVYWSLLELTGMNRVRQSAGRQFRKWRRPSQQSWVRRQELKTRRMQRNKDGIVMVIMSWAVESQTGLRMGRTNVGGASDIFHSFRIYFLSSINPKKSVRVKGLVWFLAFSTGMLPCMQSLLVLVMVH